MKILIRFDDICPTMDWEQWEKALSVLNQYNIKPLIGVIPDCGDSDLLINNSRSDFWDHIRQLQNQGYTIAMHGYNHVFDSHCVGMVNKLAKSEFAGHSYEEQVRRITAGKNILNAHGIKTEVFYAPAHSYDLCTLKALRDSGFKYVSDGKTRKPIMREGILCIPCRASGCPKIRCQRYVTAVFHAHEWARSDKAIAYKMLLKLCQKHGESIVPFDEYRRQKEGNSIIQYLDERLYMFYEYEIKPYIQRMKHGIYVIVKSGIERKKRGHNE